MKKTVVLVLLVVLAVALGPGAVREGLAWRQREDARRRVEWMLRGKVAEDEQLALCQWARGKVVMPMADMEEALPDWEAFWRGSGLGDGRHWKVVEKRIVDEITVDVTLERADDRLTLRVTENEPLERLDDR